MCRCSLGFSFPFLSPYGLVSLDGLERELYQVSLICAALATVLLISPVAYHRWVFRRHEKERLLHYANVQAILGLAMVALAVCSAVWMVLMVIGLNKLSGLFAAITTGCFAFLWFVLPVVDRFSTPSQRNPNQA